MFEHKKMYETPESGRPTKNELNAFDKRLKLLLEALDKLPADDPRVIAFEKALDGARKKVKS